MAAHYLLNIIMLLNLKKGYDHSALPPLSIADVDGTGKVSPSGRENSDAGVLVADTELSPPLLKLPPAGGWTVGSSIPNECL